MLLSPWHEWYEWNLDFNFDINNSKYPLDRRLDRNSLQKLLSIQDTYISQETYSLGFVFPASKEDNRKV